MGLGVDLGLIVAGFIIGAIGMVAWKLYNR